jgi:hypothetical protein
MSLGLDLSASDAKLDRAEEHLKSLESESSSVVKKRHSHTLRPEMDDQTGWCTIWMRANDVREPTVSAIAGDYIHNLRSALDYIITALVDKTAGLTLAKMHQFPIYDDQTTYGDAIWRPGEGVGRGSLKGIRHGLAIIEPLQPYHTQPDHDADPLAQLNRLSNADKHREILGFKPVLQPGEVDVIISEGTVLNTETPLKPNWVNNEFEVGRVLFAQPFPSQIRAKADLSVTPLFSIEPFGKDQKGIALDLPTLGEIRVHVRMITDLFKSI